MVAVFARKLLAELESDFVDTDLASENFRFLHGKDIMKLFKALITRKSLRLDFILVSFLI